jgi:hypothetical protein
MVRTTPAVGAALVPLAELERFRLAGETRRLCLQALEAAREAGCPTLTTSFLLFALVDAGAELAGGPLCRSLRQRLLGADVHAYQGVRAAYCGWYRGAWGHGERAASESGMTPYIPAVLALAEGLAGAGPVEPEHLLAALLEYTPAPGAVQPGIQYILSMIRPGLGPVRREFATHLAGPAAAAESGRG